MQAQTKTGEKDARPRVVLYFDPRMSSTADAEAMRADVEQRLGVAAVALPATVAVDPVSVDHELRHRQTLIATILAGLVPVSRIPTQDGVVEEAERLADLIITRARGAKK